MNAARVLAVDAGNTKTVAVVADGDGTVLGRATAGPGDIYGTETEDLAVAAVESAIDGALGAAGVPVDAIAAATCCLAGVDWPEDAELWRSQLARKLPRARLDVRNDGFALLWCLNPAGTGTAITVGTGPAIASRAPDGRTAVMGFWCQHPLGAVGLGEEALRSVHLAELGIGPATALREAFLDAFGCDEVEELLHQLTRRGATGGWSRIAHAAAIVTACAGSGDPVAGALVGEQARLLVDYARAVSMRAGVDLVQSGPGGRRWPVAIGGGVVSSDPLFRDALSNELSRRLPGAEVVPVLADPVVGSLIGALGQLDQHLAEAGFASLVSGALPSGAVAP